MVEKEKWELKGCEIFCFTNKYVIKKINQWYFKIYKN